jgi:hypothetical protein
MSTLEPEFCTSVPLIQNSGSQTDNKNTPQIADDLWVFCVIYA